MIPAIRSRFGRSGRHSITRTVSVPGVPVEDAGPVQDGHSARVPKPYRYRLIPRPRWAGTAVDAEPRSGRRMPMPSAIAARAGPRGSMTDDTGADHRRGHEWLFTLRRPFAHGLRCRPGSVQGRVGTTVGTDHGRHGVRRRAHGHRPERVGERTRPRFPMCGSARGHRFRGCGASAPVSRCAGADAALFQVFRGAYDRCLRGCECVRHPLPDVGERLRPPGVNAATAVSRCAEAHTADISRFGSAHGSPCAPAGPPARTGRSSRWRWRADAPPPSLPDQPDQIGVTVTVTVGVAVASTVGVTPICSRSISCSGLTLVFCLAVGSLTSRE